MCLCVCVPVHPCIRVCQHVPLLEMCVRRFPSHLLFLFLWCLRLCSPACETRTLLPMMAARVDSILILFAYRSVNLLCSHLPTLTFRRRTTRTATAACTGKASRTWTSSTGTCACEEIYTNLATMNGTVSRRYALARWRRWGVYNVGGLPWETCSSLASEAPQCVGALRRPQCSSFE